MALEDRRDLRPPGISEGSPGKAWRCFSARTACSRAETGKIWVRRACAGKHGRHALVRQRPPGSGSGRRSGCRRLGRARAPKRCAAAREHDASRSLRTRSTKRSTSLVLPIPALRTHATNRALRPPVGLQTGPVPSACSSVSPDERGSTGRIGRRGRSCQGCRGPRRFGILGPSSRRSARSRRMQRSPRSSGASPSAASGPEGRSSRLRGAAATPVSSNGGLPKSAS